LACAKKLEYVFFFKPKGQLEFQNMIVLGTPTAVPDAPGNGGGPLDWVCWNFFSASGRCTEGGYKLEKAKQGKRDEN
jgi:hypothetical protein